MKNTLVHKPTSKCDYILQISPYYTDTNTIIFQPDTPVIDHIPAGRRSPQHTMESLAARSDKQSEVVIYVLTATFVIFFAPYVSISFGNHEMNILI